MEMEIKMDSYFVFFALFNKWECRKWKQFYCNESYTIKKEYFKTRYEVT